MSCSLLDLRIWGRLGCGGRFRGRNCDISGFVVYDPISPVFVSKCSTFNIKGGCLPQVLGFEVTERI